MLRLVSHQPFCGQKTAIEENVDIASSSEVFERMEARIKIAQTDVGKKLQAQADACGTCWRPTGPARCWRTTGNKTDFEAADK